MSGGLSRFYGAEGVQSAPDEGGGGGDYKPLPAGWYPATIEAAEVKENSKKTGHLLEVKLRILTGSNKVIFERINVSNPSPKCEEIGRQKIGALGDACEIPVVKDEDLLLNRSLDVRLKIKPARTVGGKTYSEDNEVTSYARLGKHSSKAPARPAYPQGPQNPAPAPKPQGQPYQAPQQPAPAAPATKGGMPWDR